MGFQCVDVAGNALKSFEDQILGFHHLDKHMLDLFNLADLLDFFFLIHGIHLPVGILQQKTLPIEKKGRVVIKEK
jgi:hypothetical protein